MAYQLAYCLAYCFQLRDNLDVDGLDMRLPSFKAQTEQRSINLAISHRGIAALEVIDPAAAHRFLQDAIPMRGRMIHKLSGEVESQPYDRDGQVSEKPELNYDLVLIFLTFAASFPFFRCFHAQCINSIDRAILNEGLLDEVDASRTNIQMFFNHKVIAADFDKQSLVVRNTPSGEESSVPFDFCIGADGSYSVIRRQLMRVVR